MNLVRICNMGLAVGLLPNFKTRENTLVKLSDAKLLARIEFVISYLEALADSITDTGLSAQNLEDLKIIYTTYEGMTPRPKEVRTLVKLAKAELEDSREESMSIINNRLDAIMESLFEDAEPKFYLNYLDAATVEKVARRKLALMGSVVDKATKKPIRDARIVIDSIDFIHEITGEKGGFRIQKLESGSYKLRFEAPTYQTVTIDIIHRQGETNVVNVEMECIGGIKAG